MAAKDNDDRKDRDQDDGSLDMSQAAVKKMIADARERGYITYDQLNAVLPPDQVSSDQIEDVMSMLSEMGIQVTEEEESEEADQGGREVATVSGAREPVLGGARAEKHDRTDAPDRMYWRDIATVQLLPRAPYIPLPRRTESRLTSTRLRLRGRPHPPY